MLLLFQSQYIKPSKLVHIANNLESAIDDRSVDLAKNCANLKAVKSAKKEMKKWSKKREDGGGRKR